jgi:hypothetical protein
MITIPRFHEDIHFVPFVSRLPMPAIDIQHTDADLARLDAAEAKRRRKAMKRSKGAAS